MNLKIAVGLLILGLVAARNVYHNLDVRIAHIEKALLRTELPR